MNERVNFLQATLRAEAAEATVKELQAENRALREALGKFIEVAKTYEASYEAIWKRFS